MIQRKYMIIWIKQSENEIKKIDLFLISRSFSCPASSPRACIQCVLVKPITSYGWILICARIIQKITTSYPHESNKIRRLLHLQSNHQITPLNHIPPNTDSYTICSASVVWSSETLIPEHARAPVSTVRRPTRAHTNPTQPIPDQTINITIVHTKRHIQPVQ